MCLAMEAKNLLGLPKHLGKEEGLVIAPLLLPLTAHPSSPQDTVSKPLDRLADVTHMNLDADIC